MPLNRRPPGQVSGPLISLRNIKRERAKFALAAARGPRATGTPSPGDGEPGAAPGFKRGPFNWAGGKFGKTTYYQWLVGIGEGCG